MMVHINQMRLLCGQLYVHYWKGSEDVCVICYCCRAVGHVANDKQGSLVFTDLFL